ncbi:hypothetical protein RI367_006098 [Sorochytrium milnesiophthora]
MTTLATFANEIQLQFEDIVLGRVLGQGLFGKVYLADYLGTEVAVKEVFRLQDVDYEKYFEREVTVLREARHPNAVQFMGISQNNDKYYVVMEYVPNGNLKTWIEERADQLNWRLRISFATDIARALAYLHSKNIVHRDLKVENLLVTENKRVKVCDFGLSRLVAQSKEEKKRLSYCGTDCYMAPEVVLCMPFDASVDIFAYGVILCELIIGRLADGQTVLRRVIPGFGLDYSEVESLQLPGTPPELRTLAKRCTDELPQNRPGWKEILKVLQTIELQLITEQQKREEHAAATSAHVEHIGLYSDPSPPASQHNSIAHSRAASEAELNTTSKATDGSSPLHLSTNRRDAGSGSDVGSFHSPLSQHIPSTPSTPTRELAPGSPTTAEREQASLPHRFSLITAPTLAKCRACHKRIKFHKYLSCDDCELICHRRCATLVPPNCSLKHGIKDYHQRYLDDIQRRASRGEGSLARSQASTMDMEDSMPSAFAQ